MTKSGKRTITRQATKAYNFRLTEAEVEQLDVILEATGRSRTEFFEGAMRAYNDLYGKRLNTNEVQTCLRCGKLYKGSFVCPYCCCDTA